VHELSSKSVLGGGSAVLLRAYDRTTGERQSKARGQKLLTYINQRVDQVSGKAVKTALLEVVTNTKGNSARYSTRDDR
jgi:hypothetical protein